MEYLQQTYNDASQKKEDLENQINRLENQLKDLKREHKSVVLVLKSIHKALKPNSQENTQKTRNSDDRRIGIRAGSWSDKVVGVLKGNKRLSLKEIVENAATKKLTDGLTKDQLRKRVMNALKTLQKMEIINVDSTGLNNKYYLTPEND